MALKISFPSISSKLPPDVQQFLQRVREAFHKGGMVTEDDLLAAGIASRAPSGSLVPGAVDYSTPPAPTGVTASGTITAIFLQWDNPDDIGWTNFSYAEVWRSEENNLGTAVLLGTSDFFTYVDSVDPASTFYYWVRFVSKVDITGPFHGTSGVMGSTNDSPDRILDILSESITASQLHQTLGQRIDLIDGTGAGSVNARVSAEASARANADGKLFAQYAVRLDVGGKVIGFGLMSDGPSGEADTFEIRADRFIVAAPAGYEGDAAVPFVVDTVSGKTVIDGAVIKIASIQTAAIEDASITNAKIVDLSASKITSGEIVGKDIELNTGGVIRCGQTAFNTGYGFWLGMGIDGYARFSIGTPGGPGLDYDESTGELNFRGIMDLQSGSTIGGISADYIGGWASSLDNTKIDGVNIHADSSILTGSTAPTEGGRYSVLSGGDLTFYDYVNSGWVPYKSVTKTARGVCINGETVNIGYFREQPTVILSPYNLQSYDAGYPSQSQTFKLEASNLRQSGVNWLFDAVAQLNLATGVTAQTGGSETSLLPASTGSGTVDSTIITGATVTVDVTPDAITLPANTRQVSVNLRLRQQYTFRYIIVYKVPVRVVISLQYLSGSTWVTGATATLAGVNCYSMVERTASVSLTLGVDIPSIRVIATFISDSGSIATSLGLNAPIYDTMFAEITIVTSNQAATVINAAGYASYLAIG